MKNICMGVGLGLVIGIGVVICIRGASSFDEKKRGGPSR